MTPAAPLRLLALSGSLRAASSNTAALTALARLAPPDVAVTLYDGLGALPHFNPDDESPAPPPAVADLRRRIAAVDGLLISSPEYARGVPGSLKNALDWLVGGPQMPGKPVALINTSPRATAAQASLALILTTMSARLVEPAGVTLPLLGRPLDAAAIVADAELAAVLTAGLDRFVQAIRMPAGDTAQ